jgi:septum formation protein
MGTLGGFPNPPALWLRRAKPACANARCRRERGAGQSSYTAAIVSRKTDLILASASPRRRALLEGLGLAVAVEPVDIDEAIHDGEPARAYAGRVAAEKCDAAVARLGAPALAVLAADTVVVIAGEILGKPDDEARAAAMLQRLAGHRHEVLTAYRIRHGERVLERVVGSFVTFRSLHAQEVAAYLESGEWRGKAGAYAIQGIAGSFVTDVRGSFTNVVGLPLTEVLADLRALAALPGYPPPAFGVTS